MILFEGPDGAGKSFSVDYLTKPGRFTQLHLGGPPKTRNETIDRMTSIFCYPEFDSLICDRMPLFSEQVYGPIIRGKCLLNPTDIFRWSKYFIQYEVLVIYCRPSDNTLLAEPLKTKTHKPKKFLNEVLAKRKSIIEAYDRIMFQMAIEGIRIINYNRDTTPVTELLKLCVE